MRASRWITTAAVAAAAVLTFRAADAAIVPILDAVDPEGSGFRFTYQVDLQGDQRIDPTTSNPHFFTIYDFVGYVPGSEMNPAGWTFSAQPTGITPSLTNPPDSPGVVNLTWRYTGGAVIGSGLNNQVTLGEFSAVSVFGVVNTLGAFAAAATKDATNPTEDGTPAQNVGFVPVPSAIPEPSVMLLSAIGMAGGALACARRRRTPETK